METFYRTTLACLSADGGRIAHVTAQEMGVKKLANGSNTSVAVFQAASRKYH